MPQTNERFLYRCPGAATRLSGAISLTQRFAGELRALRVVFTFDKSANRSRSRTRCARAVWPLPHRTCPKVRPCRRRWRNIFLHDAQGRNQRLVVFERCVCGKRSPQPIDKGNAARTAGLIRVALNFVLPQAYCGWCCTCSTFSTTRQTHAAPGEVADEIHKSRVAM